MKLATRLIGYLHRIFDGDQRSVRALQFDYNGNINWEVSDNTLTTTVSGGSGGPLVIDLGQYTIEGLAAYIAAQAGYSVISPDYGRRIGRFADPSAETADPPVVVGATGDTFGLMGELSIAGTSVSRSGVARSEFRYTTWAADHEAVLAGVSGGSAIYAHALNDIEHITLVYGDGSGHLGEVWVERGAASDTIHWTGDYAGDLRVVAIAAANPLCVWQGTQVLGDAGHTAIAPVDTVALSQFDADPGGFGGELYAVREGRDWRFHRTGAASVTQRMAVLKLLEVGVNSDIAKRSAGILIDSTGGLGDPCYAYTSLLWAIMDAVGSELTKARQSIEVMPAQLVIDTANDDWLAEWGARFGVPRSASESTEDYAARIVSRVLRIKSNNLALEQIIEEQTGYQVEIIDIDWMFSQSMVQDYLGIIDFAPGSPPSGGYPYYGPIVNNNPLNCAFAVLIGIPDIGQMPAADVEYIRDIVTKYRAAGTVGKYFGPAGYFLHTNTAGENTNDIAYLAGPKAPTYREITL